MCGTENRLLAALRWLPTSVVTAAERSAEPAIQPDIG
jgi:hypothetical protein